MAIADYLDRVHRAADGGLARASNDGRPAGEAILDDYAFLIRGLLDLYQATGGADHLARARELLDIVTNHCDQLLMLVDGYRDLVEMEQGDTPRMGQIIEDLRSGKEVQMGSQIGRQGSAPEGGPRTLSQAPAPKPTATAASPAEGER